MPDITSFSLRFVEQKEHLLLPNVTSIKVVQHLYDVLFQYAITVEQEQKLKTFIDRIESHIKTKPRTPFSMPLTDLEFLDEGLEELRLLNWMQESLAIFDIVLDDPTDNEAEIQEGILEMLESYMTFNRIPGTNQIIIYPQGLTAY